MSMEKVIKEKTDEMVQKYKTGYAINGVNFDPVLESMFRQGVSFGISIASMALSSVPVDITFNQGEIK